ncbi:MAG TPA: TetR/AcrR family transcriptional regulator [Gaiellales bacterium]|nr:TetR/AcrR family transcriptional regulator [Gaiellales bacterium]
MDERSELPRRRGRPRSETARRAILAAALELAAERDAERVTMDAIARRARVSKETLYRWWRSKGEVLLEALAQRGEEAIPVPDTGSLAGDLGRFMRSTAAALDRPTRRLLRTLAAQAAADPAFAEQTRERFLARRRAALAAVLDRAVERGELTAPRAGIALDLVFGSLWYRLIFDVGPLDASWADAVTDAISRPT